MEDPERLSAYISNRRNGIRVDKLWWRKYGEHRRTETTRDSVQTTIPPTKALIRTSRVNCSRLAPRPSTTAPCVSAVESIWSRTPLIGAELGFNCWRFRRHLARYFLDETEAFRIECRIPQLLEGEHRHGFSNCLRSANGTTL